MNPLPLPLFALLLAVFSPASLLAQALPAIQTAASDERGRIVVNGQPFFPILLYEVPTDPESLKKIHEHGFNMITVAKTEDAEAARAAGLYSATHGRKITNFDGVLMGIGIDSPVLELKPPLLENLKADLQKSRAAVPNRPIMHAIGYWLNEPSGVVANTLPPPEKYESVVQAIDIAAPYLYPVPYQPIRSVGEAVARASAASQGKKPLLPILQIFKWTATDRFPTAAELKCMVYLSLIHGARGIGYYSYNHVTGKKGVTFEQDQPELWASLKEVNAELAQHGPFLLESRLEKTVTLKEKDAGVEMLAVGLDNGRSVLSGAGRVLLANPSDHACEVTLEVIGGGAMLKPLGKGAPISVHGVTAQVKLEANGTAAFSY